MPSPSTLAAWVGFLLFLGFFGVVFSKLANGAIPLDQLLEADLPGSESDPGGSRTYASAGRTQSLAVILFVALYYLAQMIRDPKQFPEIPGTLVALVAGSQAIYLGGKARAMLAGRWNNFFK
jgi:hypothetical protein